MRLPTASIAAISPRSRICRAGTPRSSSACDVVLDGDVLALGDVLPDLGVDRVVGFLARTRVRRRCSGPGTLADARELRRADRARRAGAQRQRALLLDALADPLQPREDRAGRDLVGDADERSAGPARPPRNSASM